MTAHARIGGSNAARTIACPGSVELGIKAKATFGEVPSKYAAEGTALHECLRRMLEDSSISADDFVGEEIEGVTITAEMVAERLQPFVDWWEKEFNVLLLENAVMGDLQFDYWTERKVEIAPDMFGTADVLGVIGGLGFVVDYKSGSGVGVDAEDNAQLKFYLVGARKSIPELKNIKKFLAIIGQPARSDGGAPFTSAVWTDAELNAFERDLKKADKASRGDKPAFATGDHCKFCPAAVMCPLLGQELKDVTKTNPAATDLAALGDLLTRAMFLETLITSLRESVMFQLESGKQVPGWKLVAKRATRAWTDESVVEAALLTAGLPPEDIYKQEIISPAQAEKKLKKEFAAVSHLCEAKSSGNTIAPSDDPRPAVSLTEAVDKHAAFARHGK